MSHFLRLLSDRDKAQSLAFVCARFRIGESDSRHFDVESESFDAVPGAPFAYWISDAVRSIFMNYPVFEDSIFTVKQGLATADNFRFVRCVWEVISNVNRWPSFAKGGAYSAFYGDLCLVVNWINNGAEIKDEICQRYPYLNGNWEFVAKNSSYYRRPGLTWSKATTLGISVRFLPAGCLFGDVGPSGFAESDDFDEICSRILIMNTAAFRYLVDVQLALAAEGRKHYEVGIIQKTPIPILNLNQRRQLVGLAQKAWSLKHKLDTTTEISHAFLLPEVLRARLGDYHQQTLYDALMNIQSQINEISFSLYGFSEVDRQVVLSQASEQNLCKLGCEDDEKDGNYTENKNLDKLLSWAVGVVFGRFDLRLATGERQAPPEPDPFDPLPAKSPGMLLDGVEAFHVHAGILVDSQGNQHDLTRLVEEVLVRVKVTVPDEVCRWLQREFFAFHLQRYSKSRRKAPIYWPLSTVSGSYTLWLYYPMLTNQTLYTAINDFIDGPNGKLKQISDEATALRNKGAVRTREDEKQFESLQAFELELTELRDTLLKLAPTYKPNLDDGVQISAAPLWLLFRHKPWQKVLKETWEKLEKGDYDWAHLAINYWPERVRLKCKTDKSLAIAHGLEELYIEPVGKVKKVRNKKNAGVDK